MPAKRVARAEPEKWSAIDLTAHEVMAYHRGFGRAMAQHLHHSECVNAGRAAVEEYRKQRKSS